MFESDVFVFIVLEVFACHRLLMNYSPHGVAPWSGSAIASIATVLWMMAEPCVVWHTVGSVAVHQADPWTTVQIIMALGRTTLVHVEWIRAAILVSHACIWIIAGSTSEAFVAKLAARDYL